MAGLLRNLIALVLALFAPRTSGPRTVTTCRFWVTPWDTGFRILKSDRYLQLAEAAQADYLIKTRLLMALVRGGVQFVNLAQLVRFSRPVAMFQRVRVESQVLFADDKCAWFSHTFWRGSERYAQVLVKMKFKKGRLTLPPGQFVDSALAEKPAYLIAWDQTLDAM